MQETKFKDDQMFFFKDDQLYKRIIKKTNNFKENQCFENKVKDDQP